MTARIQSTRSAPPWVTVFNPIARRLLRAGVPMGPNALITVRGRTSGEPRSTPLAIIELDGRRWVWSPWGDVHWVRNLRAAGGGSISVRGRTEDVRATELDPAARAAFFRDVLVPVAERMPFGMSFVGSSTGWISPTRWKPQRVASSSSSIRGTRYDSIVDVRYRRPTPANPWKKLRWSRRKRNRGGRITIAIPAKVSP